MKQGDRLLAGLAILVQALRVGNVIAALLFAAALVATLPAAGMIEARLALKYAGRVETATVLHFIQALLFLGLPSAYVIERLLAALAAILSHVEAQEPFSLANAARLRTIGWMLLALQLLDLLLGVAAIIAGALHIDFLTWQPSFTGWIAVLVAFVLARIFAHGAALRDDLEGTV